MRGGWAKVVIILALLVVTFRPTAAHSELEASFPTAGATLSTSPAIIWLQFSDPLTPGSTLTVFDTDFKAIDGLVAGVDVADNHRLAATLPVLSPGQYTVQWLALNSDGHGVEGSLQFAIQAQLFGLSAEMGQVIGLAFMLFVNLGVAALIWTWDQRNRRRLAQRRNRSARSRDV